MNESLNRDNAKERPPTISPDASNAEVALQYRRIHKNYGGIRALVDIDLDIKRGTVHALVGENGAGKSTCLGIPAGRVVPTSGEVSVFGKDLKYGDPRFSRRAGVAAIYQELTIVPALTAEANVFLGQPLSNKGFLREKTMVGLYVGLCEQIGVRANPGVLAGSLSVAEQQVLEILRGLVSDAQLILFDEPSAALAESEREALYRLIRELRERGITIVLVSHNLDEVLDLSDYVTVFRDGHLQATRPVADWTKSKLIQSMLGRSMREMYRSRERSLEKMESPLLKAQGVTLPGAVHNINIEIYEGQIVGIAGLVGSGRSSILRALAGLEPQSSGELWIEGKKVKWPKSPVDALKHGVAMIPEDRKGQGLVLQMTASDNILLGGLRAIANVGFLKNRAMEHRAAQVGQEFGFDPKRVSEVAMNLSGGNQQKLVLARWKHHIPKILLADEPTRGIDVGAKVDILESLSAMAKEGRGIILVSSELEEVIASSDRILVLARGRVVGELDNPEGNIPLSDILHLAFDLEGAHAKH